MSSGEGGGWDCKTPRSRHEPCPVEGVDGHRDGDPMHDVARNHDLVRGQMAVAGDDGARGQASPGGRGGAWSHRSSPAFPSPQPQARAQAGGAWPRRMRPDLPTHRLRTETVCTADVEPPLRPLLCMACRRLKPP